MGDQASQGKARYYGYFLAGQSAMWMGAIITAWWLWGELWEPSGSEQYITAAGVIVSIVMMIFSLGFSIQLMWKNRPSD
jgi:hypothetical protein